MLGSVVSPVARWRELLLRHTYALPIIIILVVLWLLGFIGHFGGALIHLLLLVAVVILIINLIQGRRSL